MPTSKNEPGYSMLRASRKKSFTDSDSELSGRTSGLKRCSKCISSKEKVKNLPKGKISNFYNYNWRKYQMMTGESNIDEN
jgi:hypothetical protein